ncbi:MAG: hypothetical protein P4L35_03190 [Ignavibacteriaceae bacterium]|nr:hypothetical protein [Ignavibacteriaceae bacterium]
MLFSERKGLKKFRDTIQNDNIDTELRNSLWSVFHNTLWSKIWSERNYGSQHILSGSNMYKLFNEYWFTFYKLPIDTIPFLFEDALLVIKGKFFSCPWFELYDLIEFTTQNGPSPFIHGFITLCNNILERELSAFRLIDNKIVEITSENEIESIEQALADTYKYVSVHTHLSTALTLLADRENPDYRNSIKESISAVEAITKIITSNDKATLGEALKVLEKGGKIHPAFKSSLSSLYGYTSDGDGIRHSLLDEDTLTFTDAKFMLVSCTAFINYIIGKTESD